VPNDITPIENSLLKLLTLKAGRGVIELTLQAAKYCKKHSLAPFYENILVQTELG